MLVETEPKRILTPAQMAEVVHPGAVVDVDVWMLPEPMIPNSIVIDGLLNAKSIDELSIGLFGVPVDGLAAAVSRVPINADKEDQVIH